MGKTTGFMDYARKTSTDVAPLERLENFNEFHIWLSREQQQTQAARCMDCGVPFCQANTPAADSRFWSFNAFCKSSTVSPRLAKRSG